jgi:hypothetical protein
VIDYKTARASFRSQPLHAGFERLMGTAVVDKRLANSLLCDPRSTAITFGIAAHDADKIAHIRATSLSSFAQALISAIYTPKTHVNAGYSVAASS